MTSSASFQPVQSPEWYDQRHHDSRGGFQNIWGNDRSQPFFKTMGWLLGHGFRHQPQVPPTARVVDPQTLRPTPNGIRVTWLGHATTFVEIGGKRILIDPMFSERASPVSFAGPRRIPPLPLRVEDLPGVDFVLISHDHYDHLDEQSVKDLQDQFAPQFLVPLDVGDIVEKWGAERVRELDWWQYLELDSLRFTCTPAQHFSGRGITNRNGTLWAGWYVQAPDSASVFYSGDTGYATHFREIRERLGSPDLAILPIGAYLPRWFMQVVHVDPAEAVQAFLDLEAGHLIPVHWGTFSLADDPFSEAPQLLKQAAAAKGVVDRVKLMEIGESVVLGRQAVGDRR
ncbi:MAG TPA: MBL fold metallo-hydrolase [Rhodothermales bacterium]